MKTTEIPINKFKSIYFIETEDGSIKVASINSVKISRMDLKEMSFALDKYISKLSDEDIEEFNKQNYDKLTEKPKKGIIYILKSLDLFKIGVTSDFEKRFKQYNTQNPHGIELIKKKEVDDIFKLESMILNEYNKNVEAGREWLKLTDEELEEIKYKIDYYAKGF